MILTYDDTVKKLILKSLGYKVSGAGYLKKDGKLVYDVVHGEAVKVGEIAGFTKSGVYVNDLVSMMQLTDELYKKGDTEGPLNQRT